MSKEQNAALYREMQDLARRQLDAMPLTSDERHDLSVFATDLRIEVTQRVGELESARDADDARRRMLAATALMLAFIEGDYVSRMYNNP